MQNNPEIIKQIELGAGEQISGDIADELIFMLYGKCSIEGGRFMGKNLYRDMAVFFPENSPFTVRAITDCSFLVYSFRHFKTLFNKLIFNDPGEINLGESSLMEEGVLVLNDTLKYYINNLTELIKDGSLCEKLYDLKCQELLLLFKHYYPLEKLLSFFHTTINEDGAFTLYVLSNWHKYKSAKELAFSLKYSESTFGKKFKKVFGVSPYKWINEKRANKIYQELLSGDKSIKQICADYDFNSQQQFNDYCKKNFSLPPGILRKNLPVNSVQREIGSKRQTG